MGKREFSAILFSCALWFKSLYFINKISLKSWNTPFPKLRKFWKKLSLTFKGPLIRDPIFWNLFLKRNENEENNEKKRKENKRKYSRRCHEYFLRFEIIISAPETLRNLTFGSFTQKCLETKPKYYLFSLRVVVL